MHGPSFLTTEQIKVMLLSPSPIVGHAGFESTKKDIYQKFILTLVASAFTPFINRTSESASVFSGVCVVEQSWSTFCLSVETVFAMML